MKFQTKFFQSSLILAFALSVLIFGAADVMAQGQVSRIAGANSVASTVTQTNAFVSTTSGARVYTITAFNSHTADLYLHVFDTNAVPSAGATPYIAPLRIPANSTGGYDFNASGCNFRRGVTVAASTTPITFTNASTYFDITVTYYDKNF